MRPAAVSLAALLFTRVAGAQATAPVGVAERSVEGAIALTPGATCFEQARIEAQVQSWLGRSHIPANVRVDVRGSDHNPRDVTFRIWRADKAYERRFDRLPESCDDATAVLGLAISLAIDASAFSGAFAPPAPVEPPKRLVAIELGIGMEVVPGTSAGASVGLEYGLTDWLSARLDLGTQFSFGNTIEGTTGTFDAVLGDATPGLCAGGALTGNVIMELCSGASLGVVHAQGHGYAVSRSATGPWLVAEGGVRLRVKAGVDWVLDMDGVFPIHVPVFRAENSQGQAQDRAVNPPGALLSLGPVFFF